MNMQRKRFHYRLGIIMMITAFSAMLGFLGVLFYLSTQNAFICEGGAIEGLCRIDEAHSGYAYILLALFVIFVGTLIVAGYQQQYFCEAESLERNRLFHFFHRLTVRFVSSLCRNEPMLMPCKKTLKKRVLKRAQKRIKVT